MKIFLRFVALSLALCAWATLSQAATLTPGGPYTTNVGTRITTEVTLREDGGNPLPGQVVTFEPPTGSGAYGSLASLTAVTNAQGVASIGLVTNYVPGDFTFVAKYETASTQVRVTNVRNPEAVASVQAVSSTATQTARPGTFFLQRPSVRVLDGRGQPAFNVQVIFFSTFDGLAAADFAGTSGSSVFTDTQGVATAPPIFARMVPGSFSIVVDVPHFPDTRVTFPLVAAGLPPVRMEIISGTSQVVGPNETTQPFVLRVFDVNDQPVPRAEVRWQIGGGPGGTFTATPSPMTGADGTLTTPPLGVHTFTPFSAVALCCGASVRAEFPVLIRVPVAHVLIASANDPFPETTFPFSAIIVDGNSNRLAGATVTFASETVPGSSATVTFLQTQAVTDEAGRARVDVRANDWAGDIRIRAEFNGTSYTSSLKIVPLTTLSGQFSIGDGGLRIEGGGPACTIKSFERLPSRDTDGADALIPQGYGAPLGYARFQLRHCSATVRAIISTPILPPDNGEVWLFGTTPDRPAAHWHPASGVRRDRYSMSFDIVDGGNGDATPGGDGDISVPLAAVLAPGAVNVDLYPQVQDMWWAGTSENGWGMSVVQHEGRLFAVIYGYDAAGAPTWWVMSDGTWDTNRKIFTGALYSPRGSPFYAYDSTRFVVGAPVGSMTLDFTDPTAARMSYTVNGTTGSKAIFREEFGAPATSPQLGVGDMWWGGTAQNGWGLAVLQQYATLFSVWFTYDAAGLPTWYVMPGGTWNANAYEGRLYRTTGSSWLGATYDTAALRVIDVGSYRLRFDGAGTTFESVVEGRSSSIAVTRNPF